MPHHAESAHNVSVWETSAPLPEPVALDRNLSVEVCVVGGGIAGITTAYLLAQQGKSVAVIDRGPLVCGETKHTTAHLANAIDDRYTEIEKMHGRKGAYLAAQSHSAAIDRIEQISRDEKIDCDFERVEGYLFLGEGHTEDLLKEEMEAAHRAGLDAVERLNQAPVRGFPSGPCLRFPRQGQFHPLRYLKGLVERSLAMGVQFYSNTPATEISGGAVATVQTKAGHEIRSQAVVVATNSPVNDRYAIHTKAYPYRSYVVGALVKRGTIDHALYWDTLDIYHYVRLQKHFSLNEKDGFDDDHELLIVGGEDHKTGQADDAEDRFNRLELWTRKQFPAAGKIVFRWSGQVIETLDGLAYIGKNPGEDNVFIITGDSGMGMTHGTIGGMLVSDLILGKENEWATLYDPSRKTLRALPHFAEENLNVAAQYMDLVTGGDVDSKDQILPGSGAIVRDGLKKLAVYRDDAGKVHQRSAICPHLGCVVSWNSSTKTWDCPCHGSRFDPFGKVLTGPSISDLEQST